MKISTKGRYALNLMIDLGQHSNGEYISLKDISERMGVSVKYLEQIVATLAKSGYLVSQRGSSGGYKLAMEPEKYIAGDILRVTEGSLSPIGCLDNQTAACPNSGACSALPFWKGLDDVVSDYVDHVTLKNLLDQAGSNGCSCGK